MVGGLGGKGAIGYANGKEIFICNVLSNYIIQTCFFFNSTGRARGCNSYIFPGPETFYGKKSTTSNLKVRHRKLNCDGWSILDGDFKVYTVKK